MCLECRRARPGYHGRLAARVELRVIICEICGAAAPATTNRDSGSKRQKTCLSDECRKQAARRRIERYRATERGMQVRAFAPDRASCQIWHVDCAECGQLFVARRPKQVTCSSKCRRKYHNRFVTEAIKRRYREDPEFRDLVISKAQNRRADRLGAGTITSPATLVAYLVKRDHGRCGKCHKPIRARKGPRRPSIGHIIPLALGGTHELANLQAEHLDCNLSAGARGGGEQLLLVG